LKEDGYPTFMRHPQHFPICGTIENSSWLEAGIRARKSWSAAFPWLLTVAQWQIHTRLPLRGQHRFFTCFPFNRTTFAVQHLKLMHVNTLSY